MSSDHHIPLHFQSLTLKMSSMNRAYRPLLDTLLKEFPAVGIVGPRQCGKTTLLAHVCGWRR